MSPAILEAWRRGRAAWPGIDVGQDAFARYVAERVDPAEIADALAEDLFVACACTLRDAGAILAVEERFGAQLRGVVLGIHSPQLRAEDLAQIVRQKLFVGTPSRAAAISAYRGRGSLGGWLRVTARRAALDAVRDSRSEGDALRDPDAEADDVPDRFVDPELAILSHDVRGAISEALHAAFDTLPARDQLLLRQSVLHRMSARKIAMMMDVHHGSVARWLKEARAELVTRTRAALTERLKLTGGQLESLVASVESDLDLSIARLLQ